MERSICFNIAGDPEKFQFEVIDSKPNNPRPGSFFQEKEKFRYFDLTTTFKSYKDYRAKINGIWKEKNDVIFKGEPNIGTSFEEVVLGYSVIQNSGDSWTMRLFFHLDEE